MSLFEQHRLQETIAQSPAFITTFEWALAHIEACEKLAHEIHPDPSFVLELIEHKRSHTYDVILAMWDILRVESMTEHIDEFLVLALVHDIERFTQVLTGSFSDTETGIDHALWGADLYQNNGPKVFTEHKIKLIVSGIREHSKKIPDESNEYVRLARDADKLALLREVERNLAIGEVDDENDEKYRLTLVGVAEFKSKQSVSHKHCEKNNKADALLCFLGWIYDLNFAGTKQLIINEGITDFLLDLLQKHIRPDQFKIFSEMEQQVESWKNASGDTVAV